MGFSLIINNEFILINNREGITFSKFMQKRHVLMTVLSKGFELRLLNLKMFLVFWFTLAQTAFQKWAEQSLRVPSKQGVSTGGLAVV